MTPTHWTIIAALAAFLLVVLILRKTIKRATLKALGIFINLDTHAPTPPAPGGSSMERVRAKGSVRNEDATGQRAEMRDVDAGGNVVNINTADGGSPRPKT